jgi:hypothetical protein
MLYYLPLPAKDETRMIERTGPEPDDYWMGAFVWRDDGADATFRPDGQADALGTDHDVPDAGTCWTCHVGEPGRVLVTFLWRGDADTKSAHVIAFDQGQLDSTAWLGRARMQMLPGTDVWYRTYRMPCDLLFSYRFAINGPHTINRDTPNFRPQEIHVAGAECRWAINNAKDDAAKAIRQGLEVGADLGLLVLTSGAAPVLLRSVAVGKNLATLQQAERIAVILSNLNMAQGLVRTAKSCTSAWAGLEKAIAPSGDAPSCGGNPDATNSLYNLRECQLDAVLTGLDFLRRKRAGRRHQRYAIARREPAQANHKYAAICAATN